MIKPDFSSHAPSTPEVQHFYKGVSKFGQREVNVSSIHARQKNLIERIVTLWDQDYQETNKPFTAFQNRIIELHNNGDNFGQDPEDATRLFAFLTVFGKTGYSDAKIKTLTQGTFASQKEVDAFVSKAFEGDKRWAAGFGDLKLKNLVTLEKNPAKLATLARESLQREQLKFRAAIVPHSQFNRLGLIHRLSIHASTEIGFIHTDTFIEKAVTKAENSKFAKFDLKDPDKLLQFIEKNTASNIENIITQNSEKVSKSDKISIAREKGFTAIADASEASNQERLNLEAVQRHREITAGWSETELTDCLKWINPDLDFSQASKFETVLSIARHDPDLYPKLAKELSLPENASITTILETISHTEAAKLETIGKKFEADAALAVKNGPYYLKIDAAQDLLARRLEQIAGQPEALKEIKFEKLNLKDAPEGTFATLLASGKSRSELIARGATDEQINKDVKKFFKTDEDGDPEPDSSGKFQWKDSQTEANFKKDIKDAKDLKKYQPAAEKEVEDSFGDDHKAVVENYRIIAVAHAASVAASTSGIAFNAELNKYIIDGTPISDLSINPNYNTWMTQARQKALTSEDGKQRVAKVQERLRDEKLKDYHRHNIKQSELASLGEINLAALVIKDEIDINKLPEPTKTNTEGLIDPTTNTISEAGLEKFIKGHPDLVRGSDLATLFAIFDGLSQGTAALLASDQQKSFNQMIT